MKFKNYIAIFLSMYLFALMVMPCNDSCSSHQHEESTSIQQAQNHHEEDNDSCSPFCFCTCCATAMTAIHLEVFNIVPNIAAQNFLPVNISFFSQKHSSIWQPPKLS